MITLSYSVASSTISLKSSRNPLATSIITGDIKIIILDLKTMTGGTTSQQLLC
jgi:hypothetical protein